MPVMNIKIYSKIFRWRFIPLSNEHISYSILCEKSCLMITSKSADCLPCSFIQFFIWITGFITFFSTICTMYMCVHAMCIVHLWQASTWTNFLERVMKEEKNLCEYCKIIINWGERNTKSTKKWYEKKKERNVHVTQKVIMRFFSIGVVVVAAAVERHLNQFRVFNHAHTAHSIHIFNSQLN